MKKLDIYIGRNFLIGYIVAFCVLIGMRIIIDLFVNIDEFAENIDAGALATFANIAKFYGVQSLIYFRDFAAMISVVAAAFSLSRLIRNNELIAVMASGISLKRVIAPIVLIAVVLNVLYILDQEFFIPSNAEQIVRSHDSVEGDLSLPIWFLSDSSGSIVCSPNFETKTETMQNPVIFKREKVDQFHYRSISQIRAESATYSGNGKWRLFNGIEMLKPADPLTGHSVERPIEFFHTDITPTDIPIRRKENFMELLSSAQLSALIAQGPKIKDLAHLYAQKHHRITMPIMNIIVLLVSLPVLVCRQPKNIKSAVLKSFGLSTLCFAVIILSKVAAAQAIFFRPELWSWLPVIIFLPVAFIEIDSMKT